MKILIGYNGSQISEAALDDLQHAGLPENAEVLILTVAEVWLPPENTDVAEILAWRAEMNLKEKFPLWDIKTEVTFGSPARAVGWKTTICRRASSSVTTAHTARR